MSLSAAKPAGKPQTMGRPPLGPNGTMPVNVQMTPELLACVDAAVGGKKHARSKLIREAIEEKLEREKKA